MKPSTLIAFALACSVFAQTPQPSRLRPTRANDQPAAQIRVNSDLVLVPVLVTDGSDRLVTGLDKEDFRVYDDKVEQQISHFAMDDAPVSVVLVFDTSGSMGRKLLTSKMAVAEFLREANPQDEFALVQFADKAQLAARFTSDTGVIQDKLDLLEARGRTALVDAVCLAINELKHARHARKAIFIVSDGGDNHSRFTTRDLKKKVREADVQIYSIGILDGNRGRTIEEADGPELLDDIATLTGGRLFEVDNLGALPVIARRIGSALRNQYVLGYSPSTSKEDGRYHRITVRLQQPNGQPKWKASFRSAYRVPGQ